MNVLILTSIIVVGAMLLGLIVVYFMKDTTHKYWVDYNENRAKFDYDADWRWDYEMRKRANPDI